MIIHSFTGKKFQLMHITRRIPKGTILICFSESGRLPQSLKKEGFWHGTYCTLGNWMGFGKGCIVSRFGWSDILIDQSDLRYFYTADAHRRWVNRTHRAVVKACHEELDIHRR